MSGITTTEEHKKDESVSEDKKKIADEEKEKMLESGGGEKEIRGGEVEKKKKALEEAALGDVDKRRIPIGGIKIPGFLKSTKSREKPKDGDEGEEGADLLEQPCTEVKISDEKEKEVKSSSGPRLQLLDRFSSISVPFIKRKKENNEDGNKDGEEPSAPRKPNLINAIRLPLANLVPKKNKHKDEETGVQQAGLASMETLDDESKHDDGMENIILESVDLDPEKTGLDDESPNEWSLRDWKRHWKMIKDHKIAAAGIFIFVVLFLALIITLLVGPRVPPTHAPIINGKYVSAVTSCGLVEGVKEGNVFVFHGIPYAKPPLNDLRFRTPQSLLLEDCWEGTFKAHNKTSSCWQVFTNGSLDGDEDCLTLDIYTPHVRYTYPLPVIFLVGTDSLLGGWPGKLTPVPELAHSKEIVIVRPHFRLSPLGFLAARSLSETTYPRSSGNYGLADIVQALQWTNLNIVHFGGDPKSITVLGHKAGATLVTALTTILKPEKLFARIWISSGTTVFPNVTLAESETQIDGYLGSLPCACNESSAACADCLRKLDVEDILDAIPDTWRRQPEGMLPKGEVKGRQWLVEDGIYIRQHPYDLWTSRNLSVQVVIGTTLHAEVSPAWLESHRNWTEDKILQEISESQIGVEKLTSKVVNIYNTTLQGLASMISDISTVCPLYNMHKLIPHSKFYLVTQPSDDSGLIYGGADMAAIIGPYKYKLESPNRRHLSSLRKLFYNYVSNGIPPAHSRTEISQDSVKMDSRDLELRCTLWREAGFDKFARLD